MAREGENGSRGTSAERLLRSHPASPSGRVIFHVDMDAFFASVEQRFNPHLRGKPVLICGDVESRSVVATASYEARPFGIRCGMPVGEARRRCPHGTFVEGDPAKYIHVSVRVLQILRECLPRVEPFSVDEAFGDATGMVHGRGEVLAMARQVQERIQRELCLGASIGIGPNKFIAKMASGVNKPRGITCFSRLEFRRHFDALRVGELWGVGEATEKALNQLGIQTVQDLAGFPEGKLSATFGVVGPSLRLVAQGLDDSPVVPPEEGPDAKSIGHEHTLARDEYDPGRLASHMLRLSNQVARRARLQGFAGRVVTLKIRSPDFKTRSMQSKQTHWVSDGIEIHRISLALLARMERPPGVRLVGVSLGDLTRLEQDPQELLFQEERKVRDLTQAADRLRSRMGEDVLMRAGELLCWNG